MMIRVCLPCVRRDLVRLNNTCLGSYVIIMGHTTTTKPIKTIKIIFRNFQMTIRPINITENSSLVHRARDNMPVAWDKNLCSSCLTKLPLSVWQSQICLLIQTDCTWLSQHCPAPVTQAVPDLLSAASAARCTVLTSSRDLHQHFPSSITFPSSSFSSFFRRSVLHCPFKAERPLTNTDLWEGDSSGPNIYGILGLVRRTAAPPLLSSHRSPVCI